MPSYLLHGLRLDSNLPIGGLQPAAPETGSSDVQIHLGSLPQVLDQGSPTHVWYKSLETDEAGEPALVIRRLTATGDLWLRYADGTEFLIDAAAEAVYAAWPSALTVDDAIIYLLGPVLGILLRARRRTCLHASVIAMAGQALAFLGPAGAGKSTIAAAFARAGYQVLSDDLLVLSHRGGRLCAEPGYCVLRLWPASVEGLYGSVDKLPLLVRGWGKRYYDLADDGVFCTSPLALGAIYVIGDARSDLVEPLFEAMSRRAALLQLIANTYAGRLPGSVERRQDFEAFSHLVSHLPVRRVTLGTDWSSLTLLPKRLLNDFSDVFCARAG